MYICKQTYRTITVTVYKLKTYNVLCKNYIYIYILIDIQTYVSISEREVHFGFDPRNHWLLLLLLLLLLLSRFSCVRLCATPQTAAHQALPSLGFSRQQHWSGLPCLLHCVKVKSESEVAQSCPTRSDPMNCSLTGSSIQTIHY